MVPEPLPYLQRGTTLSAPTVWGEENGLCVALIRSACSPIDGLEMLVNQGAASLRLWTGLAEVPLAVMRQAALQRLEAA